MTARLVFLTGSRAGTAFDVEEEDISVGGKSELTITFALTGIGEAWLDTVTVTLRGDGVTTVTAPSGPG